MTSLSWTELGALLVDVPQPEPTLRGAIRSVDGDESRSHHAFFRGEGDPLPVLAGQHGGDASAPYRVWRDGRLVRIEGPDGEPSLIVSDEGCFRFSADRVVVSPVSAVRYGAHGTHLLWHQPGERIFGESGRLPVGPVEPTTFLGRPAWTVEVGPPSGKTFHSRWVVDAETGIILQDHNLTTGSVDEWVELLVAESLDPALFRYEGPATTDAEVQADHQEEHERNMAARREWFTANVSALPLRVELASTVMVHRWDEETGEFEASIGETGYGGLARRPRSAAAWELRWHRVDHRWSDDRWDWAVRLDQEQLTPCGLEELKRQLGR